MGESGGSRSAAERVDKKNGGPRTRKGPLKQVEPMQRNKSSILSEDAFNHVLLLTSRVRETIIAAKDEQRRERTPSVTKRFIPPSSQSFRGFPSDQHAKVVTHFVERQRTQRRGRRGSALFYKGLRELEIGKDANQTETAKQIEKHGKHKPIGSKKTK